MTIKMRKSLLIGGAIVAIAIVITAIVLSGVIEQEEELVLSNYPKLFEKDVVIVIGENATQLEYEGAEAIAEKLYNLTGNTPVIKSDTELTEDDKAKYNLILVGDPRTNRALGEVFEITNATRITKEYPGENKGVLEILRNPWNKDKALLLVAGSDEGGMKAGSERLVKDEEALQGKIIITEQVKEDFTYAFAWGHEEQDIVPGTLYINITRIGQTRFVVKINDNDYNEWDYLVMVFDRNQNGIIDLGNTDQPHGLWANNLTVPAVLLENGCLGFAEIPPKVGPHKCTFDSNTGYTFDVLFPTLPDVNFILLRIGFVDKDVPYGDIGVVTTDNIKICLQRL